MHSVLAIIIGTSITGPQGLLLKHMRARARAHTHTGERVELECAPGLVHCPPTPCHWLLEAQAPPVPFWLLQVQPNLSDKMKEEGGGQGGGEEREQPDKIGCSCVCWPRCTLWLRLLPGISAWCALFINSRLWKLKRLPQDAGCSLQQ